MSWKKFGRVALAVAVYVALLFGVVGPLVELWSRLFYPSSPMDTEQALGMISLLFLFTVGYIWLVGVIWRKNSRGTF